MEFNYAREALKFLIKEYEIQEIFIPYYLCDVIRHAVVEVGAKPIFYHIDNEFMPAVEFPKNAYILYPNYFGICEKNVKKLTQIYPKLIVDNAHAYYAEPMGFASFNSIRKFLPVEKGATLWIGNGQNRVKKDYKRREKFFDYHKKLIDNLLEIELEEDEIPFCYPYLAKTEELADKLVEKLTEQGLIVYRYWNRLPKTYNEYKFFSRLVPIPLG